MAESRVSKREQDALERVLRRATARRDWPLVALMFNELGKFFSDQEKAAC